MLDILDGALARAGGKQTPFGGFLDSTLDRVGEGLMLGAIALVFMRDGQELALAFAVAAIGGSFLVPYARAKAEGLGIKGDVGIGSRAERVVVISAGLALAPWGVLPWAIGVLAVDRVVHGGAADPARPPRAAGDLVEGFGEISAEPSSDIPPNLLDRSFQRARARCGSGCRACGRRGRGGTRSS